MLSPLLDEIEKLDWKLSAKTNTETKYSVNAATAMIHTRGSQFVRSKLEFQKKMKDNYQYVVKVFYYHITGKLVIIRHARHRSEYWITTKTTNTQIETELCRNEEQYFMQSTLTDLSEIPLSDMLRCAAIIDKLEKKVLYGK